MMMISTCLPEVPEPEILATQFLLSMRMRNCSPRTVEAWSRHLRVFNEWCAERSILCVTQVTSEILAAYRRWLFHYQNPKSGKRLKFATQASYLMPVRRWFAWLATEEFLPDNPAADLELPKEEQRLPTTVLTAEEVESVLNQTDVHEKIGLRDRAILETLYSTGMRCGELVALEVYDVLVERRCVVVRQGKGRKDRVLPIGERALSWVNKYTADVRPAFAAQTNSSVLFVTSNGNPFYRTALSKLVRNYIDRAGITKRGSCHLLRHTAATLMMEAGADLRSLQEFLGHARLKTTEIYTHVSIQRLKEVHARTHPAKPNKRSDAQPKD